MTVREGGDVEPDGATAERQRRDAQQVDERAQGPGRPPVEPGSQSGEGIPLFLKRGSSFIQVAPNPVPKRYSCTFIVYILLEV